MMYEEVLQSLAPCGLNCSKCMAFADGEISRHARELSRLLGSFDTYAERFSKFIPVFNDYPQFKNLLEVFTKGDCRGCRKGECKYPNCIVPECSRERGADFCFQCDEFPCERATFDPNLKKRWLSMNRRMKEIGAEMYFEETRNTPRYT